jgi:hypothetical protein
VAPSISESRTGMCANAYVFLQEGTYLLSAAIISQGHWCG